MKRMTLLLTLSALLLGSVQVQAANPDKMTYEQYLQELGTWQGRENDAQQSAEAVASEMDAIREQITAAQGEIDQTWGQIYNHVSSDESGAEMFSADLTELQGEVAGLNNMSAEQLVENPARLDAIDQRLAEMRSQDLSVLSANERELDEMERMMANVRSRMERASNSWYDVVRGDCLWRISGKQQIYNDPFQWTKIYSANTEQISDPDLIFPAQRLAIPRAVKRGQYEVMRGDNFVKIAEHVYGDSTRWRQIQEANQSLLDTMGGLYPGMILTLP